MFGSVIPYISSTYSVSILYAVCFRSKHVTSSPCLECRCTSILRMFLSVPVMPWCQDAVLQMPWYRDTVMSWCREQWIVPYVLTFAVVCRSSVRLIVCSTHYRAVINVRRRAHDIISSESASVFGNLGMVLDWFGINVGMLQIFISDMWVLRHIETVTLIWTFNNISYIINSTLQ